MPPEEEGSLVQGVRDRGLDLIYLAAPTTTDARLAAIGQATSGYLYYVSLKGITGSSKLDTSEVKERIQHIRQHVSVPICVGFGIRLPKICGNFVNCGWRHRGTVLVSQVESLTMIGEDPRGIAIVFDA